MTIQPAGRGPQLVALYSFFVGLTTVTVALRAYCRVFVQKAFGWDDYFTVASWGFFVIFASFAMTGAHHGTGQHAWDIQPAEELPQGLKFWWLCEPFYLVSNMFIKASIGIMLLRLCVKKIHQAIVWTVLVVTELYSAMFFFIFLFQCLPSKYFWEQYTGGEGSCMDPFIVVAVFYGYSAITCVGDWTFSILPVFLVWDLQMGRREKVSVIMILSVGALASIATIARIPYVHTLSNKEDFLYATTDVALWSCAETALGITAASCATLRPLLRKIMPSLGFTTSSSRSRGGLSQSGLTKSGRHQRSTKGPYERSSSRREEDELKLQGLEHARGKEFGTLTSAWHPDDREDQDMEVGSSNSETMIINTKTSVYYHTVEDNTTNAPHQQPRGI